MLRWERGAKLLTDESEARELEVVTVRPHQGDYIVKFVGINDRNTADALRGVQLSIPRSDRRQRESGERWPEDIVGCSVVSTTGDHVGTVVDVITGASQDHLIVELADEARDVRLPR